MLVKFCYSNETDTDFIRWTSNLFRRFISTGKMRHVAKTDAPDLMIHSIWREQEFLPNIPTILISNENWKIFAPHAPLSSYRAVLGLYFPPSREPFTFIQYPYAAVHYDCAIEDLYAMRKRLLHKPKTKFCCFVNSNKSIGNLTSMRNNVFDNIHAWKPVDSGGGHLNNIGTFAPRGLAFLEWISDYKYMICIENSYESGYITEKPFQAWFAGTIPIYHGGAMDRLNHESFLHAQGDIVSKISKLEENDTLYSKMQNAPLTQNKLSLGDFEKSFFQHSLSNFMSIPRRVA